MSRDTSKELLRRVIHSRVLLLLDITSHVRTTLRLQSEQRVSHSLQYRVVTLRRFSATLKASLPLSALCKIEVFHVGLKLLSVALPAVTNIFVGFPFGFRF